MSVDLLATSMRASGAFGSRDEADPEKLAVGCHYPDPFTHLLQIYLLRITAKDAARAPTGPKRPILVTMCPAP